MTAELLVNVTPSETRVAYIDGGILQEIHIEREARRGIVGNIYKGRVSRVLPGMQAAFVDIGLDKAAFLHASDIMPHTECVAGEEQKQFAVRDISELVERGIVSGASFGFTVPEGGDTWLERGDGSMLRELRSVQLHEVTITATPAYVDAKVAMRSRKAIEDARSFDDWVNNPIGILWLETCR